MALLFTLLLCGAGAALGYINFYLNQQQFLDSAERQINAEIRLLRMAERNHLLIDEIARTTNQNAVLVLLTNAQKNWIGGNMVAEPNMVKVLREGTLGFQQPDGRFFAARIHTFEDGRRLLVALDITTPMAEHRLLQILGLISLVLMGVVIASSFLISTFVVSRTNRIANTARQMMETGDLSRRIKVDSSWDDLSNMSYVLNLFLARLEELVQGVRLVSDNIAHDLRTPLTRLRNDLESLRLEATDSETLHPRIDNMIQDTDGLLGIFNALLRISRLEATGQATKLQRLDLADVLADVCDLYDPVAEEKQLQLKHTLTPAVITGDRNLLFQIFANIVDNAIKYTPSGGCVTVTCSIEAGQALATVADTGPGIPDNDHNKVFERFYRVESSRTSPGSGLGLSLVKAAVTIHGGRISLRNTAPGLRVQISLPADR